jgi:MinD superfamily P-loop ATPase
MIALNEDNCSGCGTCAMVCPHRVLDVRDNKARLAFEPACIECAACQLNCHEDAIIVTKGVGCLLAIIRDDVLKLDKSRSSSCC